MPQLCKPGSVVPTVDTAGIGACRGFYQAVHSTFYHRERSSYCRKVVITVIILRITVLDEDVILR